MAPPIPIILVADDLTGALDAVAPFANAGLVAHVAGSPGDLAELLARPADVLAVCTNSRERGAAEAAGLVAAVAGETRAIPVAFKKIDSRLKGNVAAEVAAVARARGLKTALVCPAIPDMGRVVRQGRLCGFGVAEPIGIAALFAGQPDLAVHAPDVETDADIDRVLAQTPPDTLFVGARGLAAGLARRRAGAAQTAALPLPRPLVFVIGSRDPITLAQVNYLRTDHPEALFLNAPNGHLDAMVAPQPLTILQATPGETPSAGPEVSARLAKAFARHLLPASACVVLTGGETAAAILSRIGIGQLQVLAEVLPGLPLCRALNDPSAPLIVAKSGGFGAPDTLSRLARPNSEAP